MKPGKPVWVDRTAVGRMLHSTPMALMMGRATVREHFPTQEMSWMLTMRFMGESFRKGPKRCGGRVYPEYGCSDMPTLRQLHKVSLLPE